MSSEPSDLMPRLIILVVQIKQLIQNPLPRYTTTAPDTQAGTHRPRTYLKQFKNAGASSSLQQILLRLRPQNFSRRLKTSLIRTQHAREDRNFPKGVIVGGSYKCSPGLMSIDLVCLIKVNVI